LKNQIIKRLNVTLDQFKIVFKGRTLTGTHLILIISDYLLFFCVHESLAIYIFYYGMMN